MLAAYNYLLAIDMPLMLAQLTDHRTEPGEL
jgi:hypothetical protein